MFALELDLAKIYGVYMWEQGHFCHSTLFSWFSRRLLATLYVIWLGDTLSWLWTVIQKHAPDRVTKVITTPQPLFGLAEPLKSRIWPQHSARHKFVKRNKEKSTTHAVSGVTGKASHCFTSRDSMHTTECVFPISLVVCFSYFLFPHFFILYWNTCHSFMFLQQVVFHDVNVRGKLAQRMSWRFGTDQV